MAGIAAAIGIGGVLGAGASIYGANKQASASQNAIAAEQAMFGTALNEYRTASANQTPFIQAGQQASGTLADLLRPGADMSSILKNIPGFDFLQKLTQMGVSNQGTTTGLGGNTLLAGANAGTNIALNAGWLPIVNSLQGLITAGAGAAGSVQQGAAALGGQAIGAGGQIGSAYTGIGNAYAGGATAVGANIGNSLTSGLLLNKLLNPQGGAGYEGQGMYFGNNTIPVAGTNESISLPPVRAA